MNAWDFLDRHWGFWFVIGLWFILGGFARVLSAILTVTVKHVGKEKTDK